MTHEEKLARRRELYELNKEKRLIQRKDSYLKNKDKVSLAKKEYYIENKEYIKKKSEEYNQEHREEVLRNKNIRYYNNREASLIERRQYYIENKETIIKRNGNYIKERLKKDPLFKLSKDISSSIRMSLKNNGSIKNSRTHEILGCTIEQFKIHIENKFVDGMCWENRNLWHLDHITPISSATNEEELIKLNHYTNFQPLWAPDNLEKGNKLNWTQQKHQP